MASNESDETGGADVDAESRYFCGSRTVGAERCILSTDLGQIWNPLPVEGMRMFIVTLVKYGINEDEINLMAKINPGKLLGLNA